MMTLHLMNGMEGAKQAEQPCQDALLIDAEGLAKMLDRSLTSIRRDDQSGRIPRPITLGGAKKWRVAEVRAWVQAGCPKRKVWETMNQPLRLAKVG
jgi:predicted DNA-binding transcriptional regulator AlpA